MDMMKDDIHKLFYKYLIPAISSSVAVAVYSFVDTIAIGQGVGALGMAACAVVLPIFIIANFIALVCGIGGAVLMSQERGRGEQEKGNMYFTAAFLLLLIVLLPAWGLGFTFQEPFYRLCGADDSVMPYAIEYGTWIFGFMPSFVLTTFLGCFIRMDGSPKLVMNVTLIGSVINIVGDWLFVFPMKMGMTGAALATVLGSAAQAVLLLIHLLAKKTNLRFIKPSKWGMSLRRIIVVGFGAGINQIAVIVITFITNNQIMRYSGASALAVYGMLSTIATLFMSLFNGIGQAAQPIVSVNYGSGQQNRYWAVGKLGLKTAALCGLSFIVFCCAFPSQITKVFMQVTPEIEGIAPYILRVYALSFLPQAVNIFITLYLQSIMHPKVATAIAFSRGLILNGALLFLLPLCIGANGIWWAIPLAEGITAMIAILYVGFLYRRYRQHENENGQQMV